MTVGTYRPDGLSDATSRINVRRFASLKKKLLNTSWEHSYFGEPTISERLCINLITALARHLQVSTYALANNLPQPCECLSNIYAKA